MLGIYDLNFEYTVLNTLEYTVLFKRKRMIQDCRNQAVLNDNPLQYTVIEHALERARKFGRYWLIFTLRTEGVHADQQFSFLRLLVIRVKIFLLCFFFSFAIA